MKLTVYKWCRLMNPDEGDEFGTVAPVLRHGIVEDPRSLVAVRIGSQIKVRNIFDVVFLNKKKEKIRNSWLCPGTTLSEVCRVVGIDRWGEYDEEFLENLAEKGYPRKPERQKSRFLVVWGKR